MGNWDYVDEADKTEIRACVDCFISNATSNGDTLGNDEPTKKNSVEGLSKQMGATEEGIRHVRILVDKAHNAQGPNKGRAVVLFHKFNWMSKFGVRRPSIRRFGEVWIVSIGFDEKILTDKTNETPHKTFVGNLTSTEDGPIRKFLQDQSVGKPTALTSLFVIGPLGVEPPADPDAKKIGTLERIASEIESNPAVKWKIRGATPIDKTYHGINPETNLDVKIPTSVLTRWGGTMGKKFQLTEIEFF